MAKVVKTPPIYVDSVTAAMRTYDAADDLKEYLPLIERCYEAKLDPIEAARRMDLHFSNRKVAPEVDVYMPNDNPEVAAPFFIELFKEGIGGVSKIRNESMSHPRLVIEHDDGMETTIVGMPFVLRSKPEQDMSTDDEIPEAKNHPKL